MQHDPDFERLLRQAREQGEGVTRDARRAADATRAANEAAATVRAQQAAEAAQASKRAQANETQLLQQIGVLGLMQQFVDSLSRFRGGKIQREDRTHTYYDYSRDADNDATKTYGYNYTTNGYSYFVPKRKVEVQIGKYSSDKKRFPSYSGVLAAFVGGVYRVVWLDNWCPAERKPIANGYNPSMSNFVETARRHTREQLVSIAGDIAAGRVRTY